MRDYLFFASGCLWMPAYMETHNQWLWLCVLALALILIFKVRNAS